MCTRTDSVEDASKLLISRDPLVAHSLRRTPACRVRTLANTVVRKTSGRSQECERGTQECARHGRLHHLWWASRPMETPFWSRLGRQTAGRPMAVAYSWRSAVIGSTFVARRAGQKDAKRPANNKRTATAMN